MDRLLIKPMLGTAGRWLGGAGDGPAIDPGTVRRVLWMRLDHIGDVVMSLPALQALKVYLPEASVDVVVRPSMAPLLRLVHSGRLYAYDTPRFPERGLGAGLFRTNAMVRRLRHRQYDVALDLRGDDVVRMLARASGARRRIGPDRVLYEKPGTPNLSRLMTHVVPLPETPRHAVLNAMALLQPLGCGAPPPEFRLPVTEAARWQVRRKLDALGVGARYVVAHTQAHDLVRNWPRRHWLQFCDRLLAEQDDHLVLLGSATDSEAITLLKHDIRRRERVVNASGLFPLVQLPALLQDSRGFVGVDSGPMHLAWASGCPVTAIFLPQLAPWHGPWGQPEGIVTPHDPQLAAIPLAEMAMLRDREPLAAVSPETVYLVFTQRL